MDVHTGRSVQIIQHDESQYETLWLEAFGRGTLKLASLIAFPTTQEEVSIVFVCYRETMILEVAVGPVAS